MANLGCLQDTWDSWVYFQGFTKDKRYLESGFGRMQKEINPMEANYLSFGGRITLIKATFSNLRIYYLSLFKIPKAVALKIERLQSNSSEEDKKPQNPINKLESSLSGKEIRWLGFGRTYQQDSCLIEQVDVEVSIEQHTLWTAIVQRAWLQLLGCRSYPFPIASQPVASSRLYLSFFHIQSCCQGVLTEFGFSSIFGWISAPSTIFPWLYNISLLPQSTVASLRSQSSKLGLPFLQKSQGS